MLCNDATSLCRMWEYFFTERYVCTTWHLNRIMWQLGKGWSKRPPFDVLTALALIRFGDPED